MTQTCQDRHNTTWTATTRNF